MYKDRWTRPQGAAKGRDGFGSILSENQFSAINIVKNGGKGFGLPPTDKFRSGHLANGTIPVSQTNRVANNHGRSGSDMETSSDSEDDVYGGQYSLDSSPQDGNSNGGNVKYTASVRVNPVINYSIDKKNFSSHRLNVLCDQDSIVRTGPAEAELSDSATTTEVSSTHFQGSNGAAPWSRGYSSSAASQPNSETTTHDRKNGSSKNMPSAPPISSGSPFNLLVGKFAASEADDKSYYGDLNGFGRNEVKSSEDIYSHNTSAKGTGFGTAGQSERMASGKESSISTFSTPRLPIFHASGLGPWVAVISYDACVRLCLHSWAKGCSEEAPYFLNNECKILRDSFGLQHTLLQSEDELLARKNSVLVSEGTAPKSTKTYGKMKVQVRKIKMGVDMPVGCSFSSLNPSVIKVELLRQRLNSISSKVHSGWDAVRKVRVTTAIPPHGSFQQQGLAYMRASSQYLKEVSKLLRNGLTTSHNRSLSDDAVQETHTCFLRMKSASEEDLVQMQPGSSDTHIFLPENYGDALIIELKDSKGKYCGHVLCQVAAVVDDPSDKLRWWPIYREPDHELIGKLQLCIHYSTAPDESNKCGCVAETVAYDFVSEVAMKIQNFQQRNLLLHGPWNWLVAEFASYYGVSDAYTKLRYLSYIMDVATPTKDCLDLVHDLLQPVILKGNRKSVLSHQENRILGEVEDQIQQTIALVFENYKSLNESLPSGVMDVFAPATGLVAPALKPAIKLYMLLHDVLSPEAQLKFSRYFQVAAKKRSRRHVTETDEFISGKEGTLMDSVTLVTSYQKMKSLVLSIRNEISTDIEINNQNVFPSFMDLPNLCASIYSVDLFNRLRSFLVSCPPPGPSAPIVDLVMATADLQAQLASWNINPIKGGIDAKELFHSYITLWIQDKRLSLLELCKPETVNSLVVKTQNSTNLFVDEMYGRLKETLNEYEVIISRWPEYIAPLENAIADIERATIEALDKHYADALSPIKDVIAPKIFGLKYVQKFAKRTGEIYLLSEELGTLLNTLKKMLDILWPNIETKLKSWSCHIISDGTNTSTGEYLSEVTVMLRSKYRSYLQAVVEKLLENTKLQGATKLKKIIQDSKETVVESDVRGSMQTLKEMLIKIIEHLHSVVESHVYIPICRGLWDRMGQEVLQLLQNKKDNRSWYKASRIALSVLDDIFASEMHLLVGNLLQEKDVEPPRSIMEARSVLCKDAVNHQDTNYYY